MKQKHHFIPVSLYGLDDKVNIIKIDSSVHRHFHDVCNYSMREYSTMYRKFRRAHNHKSKWDAHMVDDILKMQGGYLNRYSALAFGPQKLHMQMMNNLTEYYEPNHTVQHRWSKLWYEYCQAFKNYHL